MVECCFKWGLMGDPKGKMEDFVQISSNLNSADLAQEVSENFSMWQRLFWRYFGGYFLSLSEEYAQG